MITPVTDVRKKEEWDVFFLPASAAVLRDVFFPISLRFVSFVGAAMMDADVGQQSLCTMMLFPRFAQRNVGDF
jgi:hypothetical protein